MREIQRHLDEYEAASKDEANWYDVDEEEEKPYILEGKRISMTDLQVILESAVKMNMLADDQVIAGWLQSHL